MRVRLDPEFLTVADLIRNYIAGVSVFITWRTAKGFEVERAGNHHFKLYDESRPIMAVHICNLDAVRKELTVPYTLTKVTIAITQPTTAEMELPF